MKKTLLSKLWVPVLAWLLHHANRHTRAYYFYAIKKKLLSKYGTHIGYDVQYIDGKVCFNCNGSGIDLEHQVEYEEYGGADDEDVKCDRCVNGWFKLPLWIVLQRFQLGKYIFHTPTSKTYKKPDDVDISKNIIINGYITHNISPYGNFALGTIYFLYDFPAFRLYFIGPMRRKIPRINWKKYFRKAADNETDDLPF